MLSLVSLSHKDPCHALIVGSLHISMKCREFMHSLKKKNYPTDASSRLNGPLHCICIVDV